MKTPLLILFLCILLTACGTNGSRENATSDNQEPTNTEMEGKKFPKAACILWIDKNKVKTLMNKEVRNVKARVHIGELGKITVLEYEKTPHIMLEDKIGRCLKTYRVTPEQMEKGNLKEGETSCSCEWWCGKCGRDKGLVIHLRHSNSLIISQYDASEGVRQTFL